MLASIVRAFEDEIVAEFEELTRSSAAVASVIVERDVAVRALDAPSVILEE